MSYKNYLPDNLKNWIEEKGKNASDITIIKGKKLFLEKNGEITEAPYCVDEKMFEDIIMRICKGSLYANQNTLKKGYITVKGGHRIGFSGTCVTDNEKSAYMRDINAINIRISRAIEGAADIIMPHIMIDKRIFNTVIISPPSCGKTTALRDIARQLGNRMRVGVVDERGEIANGKNIGNYTFVMAGCSKTEGILMMLRSMAPKVILTDEIGEEADEKAIEKLINAGVKIICTAHGYDEKDIMRRKTIADLIRTRVLEKIIVLSDARGPGTVENVISL